MYRLVCILSILLVTMPAFAYRRPIPESDWDEATQLTLAKAMVGEADWHEPDHIAIAYVLSRRWQQYLMNRGPISFQKYIELYSAPLHSSSERSKWVQSLPWGPLPGPFEGRWNRVQALVKAWGEGRVKDPCPNARHWGGAMDRPGRTLHPISCGLTRNIFYARRDLLNAR